MCQVEARRNDPFLFPRWSKVYATAGLSVPWKICWVPNLGITVHKFLEILILGMRPFRGNKIYWSYRIGVHKWLIATSLNLRYRLQTLESKLENYPQLIRAWGLIRDQVNLHLPTHQDAGQGPPCSRRLTGTSHLHRKYTPQSSTGGCLL